VNLPAVFKQPLFPIQWLLPIKLFNCFVVVNSSRFLAKSICSILLIGLPDADISVKRGVDFTSRNLRYDVIHGSILENVSALKVPVYFFSGPLRLHRSYALHDAVVREDQCAGEETCLVRSFSAFYIFGGTKSVCH
jgi:hypothetical protein